MAYQRKSCQPGQYLTGSPCEKAEIGTPQVGHYLTHDSGEPAVLVTEKITTKSAAPTATELEASSEMMREIAEKYAQARDVVETYQRNKRIEKYLDSLW